MKFKFLCAISMMFFAGHAHADEYEAKLLDLAKSGIATIAANPTVIKAVKDQNVVTSTYDQAKIDSLDQEWRAEVGAGDQPLIAKVLAEPASAELTAAREASGGLYTEIFVMDAKGLNVAQSDVTSDYWQGDEPKWQESFGKGPDGIHISEVEQDESTQTFQSQVSMTVKDPDSGAAIGAITVGVNVELLP